MKTFSGVFMLILSMFFFSKILWCGRHVLVAGNPDLALSLEGHGCNSCGSECKVVCGSRQFRTCCFNYIKRKRSEGSGGEYPFPGLLSSGGQQQGPEDPPSELKRHQQQRFLGKGSKSWLGLEQQPDDTIEELVMGEPLRVTHVDPSSSSSSLTSKGFSSSSGEEASTIAIQDAPQNIIVDQHFVLPKFISHSRKGHNPPPPSGVNIGNGV